MAGYNRTNFSVSVPTQDESNRVLNKVFINPNFKKGAVRPNDQCLNQPINVMHVNPKFPHTTNTLSNRIYINPNFIQSNCNQEHSSIKVNALSSHEKSEYVNNIQNKNTKSTTEFILPPLKNQSHHNQQPTTINSRYCLVRNSVTMNQQQPTEPKVDAVMRTVKLSKYKSVRLKDVKKKLNTVKEIIKPPQLTPHIINVSKYNPVANAYKSQFKIVKHKTETLKTIVKNLPTKSSADLLVKNAVKYDIRRKLKHFKGNLKKNNIPCPLFKKYGKCLRNIRGNCEYLHDKKHVSICRKFLKGICHDKDCLLSHELTDKKMPTCYFYLQGMCTKEDCPYLHVKLNEKTKICADFVKGYCEKGDKCLNRHIHVCNVAKKQTSLKRQYKSSISKLKMIKTVKINILATNNTSAPNVNTEEKHSDHRYYTESTDSTANTGEGETYEIIKPTRCKLGTLPSFIKL